MQLLNKTRQLEAVIREQIRSGVWEPSDRMPSEDALMAQFGVSRPSMREALNTLVSEGIIERRHGSGTYVKRVPVGRIAVFARLDNITSPMGDWHRDMVVKINDHCRHESMKAEVLVVHGQDMEEIRESFIRSVQMLPLAELEGAICLTPLGSFHDVLTEMDIPHVSMTSAVPGSGPSVVLDYMSMSKMMREQMLARGHEDFVVMHVQEPSGTVDPGLIDQMEACVNWLTQGRTDRRLPVPCIEKAPEVFRAWWRSRPRSRKPRSIVFLDDALCDVCCKVIWEERIVLPAQLAVLTQAGADKEFILPVTPDRMVFHSKDAADQAWKLLERARQGTLNSDKDEVFIEPLYCSGQSL